METRLLAPRDKRGRGARAELVESQGGVGDGVGDGVGAQTVLRLGSPSEGGKGLCLGLLGQPQAAPRPSSSWSWGLPGFLKPQEDPQD